MRGRYLAALNDLKFFYDIEINVNEARWLIARNALVRSIKFSHFHETWLAYIHKFRNNLSSISCSHLFDRDLNQIGSCPLLTALTVDSLKADNDSLQSFLQRNPQIERLLLPRCEAISSLGALLSCCPNLEALDLSTNEWFNDSHLLEIIASCPRLKIIDFKDTFVESDDLIQALVKAYPNIFSII
jgi:hypothetical protein